MIKGQQIIILKNKANRNCYVKMSKKSIIILDINVDICIISPIKPKRQLIFNNRNFSEKNCIL